MMQISGMPMEGARRITRHRMLKEYGERLLRLRKERGITRIELFERTGISISDIYKTELGLLELSKEQRFQIGKFLRRQRII